VIAVQATPASLALVAGIGFILLVQVFWIVVLRR
jgi:hypothetical protein